MIVFISTCQELHKTYTVSPDLLEEKAPALTGVEGTKIEWKHKKNLCMTEVKKKQKAKAGRKAGQVQLPSFLHHLNLPSHVLIIIPCIQDSLCYKA